MATIPTLPSRDDVLRMARSTTDITGQLLDTAGNLTRIALNTFDPRDGSGAEVLRVLRQTTAELAEASASPQAQEAFYRIVETLTRLGTSGAPLAVHPVSEPAQALLAALGDSLLPVLDAVEPAIEEFAAALGELVEGTSPLLPATAGVAAGALLAVTPLLRTAAEVLRESSPELRRIADALTAAMAPLMPLQVALAERTAAAGRERRPRRSPAACRPHGGGGGHGQGRPPRPDHAARNSSWPDWNASSRSCSPGPRAPDAWHAGSRYGCRRRSVRQPSRGSWWPSAPCRGHGDPAPKRL